MKRSFLLLYQEVKQCQSIPELLKQIAAFTSTQRLTVCTFLVAYLLSLGDNITHQELQQTTYQIQPLFQEVNQLSCFSTSRLQLPSHLSSGLAMDWLLKLNLTFTSFQPEMTFNSVLSFGLELCSSNRYKITKHDYIKKSAASILSGTSHYEFITETQSRLCTRQGKGEIFKWECDPFPLHSAGDATPAELLNCVWFWASLCKEPLTPELETTTLSSIQDQRQQAQTETQKSLSEHQKTQ